VISLLASFLILLVPVSGVVSGGRSVSFAMKGGLIPSEAWLCIPGLPASGTGNFTSISLQTGREKNLRIVSSGETAGLHPLVASRVTRNGHAAQLLLSGISLLAVREHEAASCAVSFAGATIELRGWPGGHPATALEYSAENILLAFTENTGSAGVSFPIMEDVSVGPAWCADSEEQCFWIQAHAVTGPLTLVSSPAIDEISCFRRIHGVISSDPATLVLGWDGEDVFGEIMFENGELAAAAVWPSPGVMLGFRPSDSLLLIASHREEGWLQGEIQGEYGGFTLGGSVIRSSDRRLSWGFSAGIDVGNHVPARFASPEEPWWEQMAVSSFQD